MNNGGTDFIRLIFLLLTIINVKQDIYKSYLKAQENDTMQAETLGNKIFEKGNIVAIHI